MQKNRPSRVKTNEIVLHHCVYLIWIHWYNTKPIWLLTKNATIEEKEEGIVPCKQKQWVSEPKISRTTEKSSRRKNRKTSYKKLEVLFAQLPHIRCVVCVPVSFLSQIFLHNNHSSRSEIVTFWLLDKYKRTRSSMGLLLSSWIPYKLVNI